MPNIGASGDIDVTETNSSAVEDQEGKFGQTGLSQKTIAEPSRPSEASQPPPSKGGAGTSPPAPNTRYQTAVEWPDKMEEVVNGSSIVAEHHALMSAVLHSVRSVNSSLKVAFGVLLTGFEESRVMLFI